MPSAKPTIGLDDLKTLFPHIAKEAYGWDPSSLKSGSNEVKQWKCPVGHQYEQSIKKRSQGKGCPYCKGKKVWIGFNDLWTTHPDVAREAYGWDPRTYTAGSGKKVTWKCKIGHRYTAVIRSRTPPQNSGCPICANKLVEGGFNDLLTHFPAIAAEADGWDPATVTSGSNKKLQWKCKEGHRWKEVVNLRTPPRNYGCPFCSGRRIQPGFNDLRTLFPNVAAEASGWDPGVIAAKSGEKMAWQCKYGHKWTATVAHRTNEGTSCPVCAGKQVLKGFNDLSTICPDIANEANGWDPSQISVGSNAKLSWKCQYGHTWVATVVNRTPPRSGKCPICIGKTVLKGFNDLATLYPKFAIEAYGWDPHSVTPKTNKALEWKCAKGHIWKATPNARTPPRNTGCPICSGQKVLAGFNDLATLRPLIAKEANGWDASTVTVGSSQRKSWRCENGHIWNAVVSSRTSAERGSGCPECAEYGFNPSKKAWFYLMQRPGEQQIGISNDIERRINTHERNGWLLLDKVGPAKGSIVLETEKRLKMWLRQEIGVIEGTTENWKTISMEVQTLAELKEKSAIDTDLF